MRVSSWLPAVVVLACGLASGAGAQQVDEPKPADAPKPALVASVNGIALTEAEFQRRCERRVGGAPDTAVGFLVLKEWLQQTLIEEEAKKRGLLPKPEDVERRVRALRKQWEFRGENFDDWLLNHGRSLETLREELGRQLTAENLLTEGVSTSDVEVLNYYSGNKAALGVPEQIRISRITVNTREAAKAVETGLKKGQPFEELARAHSLDPFKPAGGRVPEPIDADPTAESAVEREVLEKLLKLESGKTAGPVKVENYWVFARVEERTPARAPGLEDVRELIAANLRLAKSGPEKLKAAQERMLQLQREAKLEIFRPEYRHLAKLIQGNAGSPDK